MSKPHEPRVPRLLLFWVGALLGVLCIQFAARVHAQEASPVETTSTTIATTYPPPEGAQRAEAGAFGRWLGTLDLAPPTEPVRTHDGRVVPGDFHVIELPLVKGNLQQCADTAIRLRAEWLREQGREIVFHATSGDPMPWSRYRDGEKAYAPGNYLVWKPADPQSWDQYLSAVFTWAGTMSLSHDTVPAKQPQAGDILVLPGAPGHAVVLLDVARSAERSYLLVGQGYMPAQDFHLVRGPHQGWWLWDDGASVGPWDFPASSLRRWKEP